MVFNATFNNISVISWRSVLLVEKPRVLEKITCYCTVRVYVDNHFCEGVSFLNGSESVVFFIGFFLYICFVVGDSIIRRGGLGFY